MLMKTSLIGDDVYLRATHYREGWIIKKPVKPVRG